MAPPLRAHPAIPQFRCPLPVPPVLQPIRRDSAADYYEIAQREASVEIIPGMHTRIWGYEGIFPGPTIEARRGRAAVVTHTNRLGIPTVAHLHGGVTRPQSDGFPTDTVAPGGTRTYEYDNLGRPATLWYHDHSWRGTGRNLYMGLAGFYLLKEDSDIDGQLPNGPYDVPLMLHDRAFTADGQLDYDHDAHHGATGRVMLVNGAPWPVLEVAARKYRFRILNASNASAMRLALSTHHPLIQIGSDQGLLAAPVVLSTIGLAMAERVEIVVDFSVYPLGTRVVLENRRGEGPLRSVMRFDVVRSARDDSRVPARLSDIEPLGRSQAVRTRTFRVWREAHARSAAGRSLGHQWRAIRLAARRRQSPPRRRRTLALRQSPVRRTDDGASGAHAPRAIPGAEPERPCASSPGARLERYRRDRSGEEVEVILRWSGYKGRYLLHCHNLEHEDHSMMARVDVV